MTHRQMANRRGFAYYSPRDWLRDQHCEDDSKVGSEETLSYEEIGRRIYEHQKVCATGGKSWEVPHFVAQHQDWPGKIEGKNLTRTNAVSFRQERGPRRTSRLWSIQAISCFPVVVQPHG